MGNGAAGSGTRYLTTAELASNRFPKGTTKKPPEVLTPGGFSMEVMGHPAVDRSYLDPYPNYALYARSYLEHILPDTVPEAHEITTG